MDPVATAASITAISHGRDFLLPAGFTPNFWSPHQANTAVSSLPLELYVQADVIAGRAIIMPLALQLLLTTTANLAVNVSSMFLVGKSDKPLGRYVRE